MISFLVIGGAKIDYATHSKKQVPVIMSVLYIVAKLEAAPGLEPDLRLRPIAAADGPDRLLAAQSMPPPPRPGARSEITFRSQRLIVQLLLAAQSLASSPQI